MKICTKCKESREITDFSPKDKEQRYRHNWCRFCVNERRRERRSENPTYYRRQKQDHILKTRYGLSIQVYDAMLKEQGGVCYICKLSSETRSLAVDHNHRTGEVRKLLCSSCNTGLGLFQDNPSLLVKAAAYLLEHGEEF